MRRSVVKLVCLWIFAFLAVVAVRTGLRARSTQAARAGRIKPPGATRLDDLLERDPSAASALSKALDDSTRELLRPRGELALADSHDERVVVDVILDMSPVGEGSWRAKSVELIQATPSLGRATQECILERMSLLPAIRLDTIRPPSRLVYSFCYNRIRRTTARL